MSSFLEPTPVMRSHRHAAIVIAAMLSTACAPQRPAPGALAPVSARGTNQSRAADLAAIDAWETRRVALLRNDGSDLAARGIALARAGAWIAFAHEAYVANPGARDADDALAEARRLMAPYDGAHSSTTVRTTLASNADRLSPDNWAEVGRLASEPEKVADVARLAAAEIELVRATAVPARILEPSVVLAGTPAGSAVVLPTTLSSTSVSALSCPAVQHLARAVALLGEADLVQQGEARQLAVIDRINQDERVRARLVHFAVRSDELGLPSTALLNGVVGAMKAHPELSIVIEAHTDPRGSDSSNIELAGRRGTTVRDILADSGVADERMLVRQFGERRRVASGGTAMDFARDRRVRLRFVLPDGEELAINDDSEVDLQIERVVQRSKTITRRKGWKPNVRRIVAAPRPESATDRRAPR